MPPSCAPLGGFAIVARVALLWQLATLWKCVAEPSGIRQAHRTPHALRMREACGEDSPHRDKIDAPAACAVPFRPYCGDVVTRNA